jgi:hypothetical protein
MEFRPLNASERRLLDVLLTRDFPGRDELRLQAQTVQTTGRSCGCGCPTFALVADRALPPARVKEHMVSDAHGNDPAGHPVGVLLFVKDGYLSEIEVYSVTGADIAGLPEGGALTLSEWSEWTDRGESHLLNP